MRRSTPVLTLPLLLALASPAQAGGPTLVRMIDPMRFDPRTVTVAQGEEVAWRNDGNLRHNTRSLQRYPTAWDRDLASDASYTKRFNLAGTFPYYCDMHSNGTDGMTGTLRVPLIVSPASGSNATTFTIRVGAEPPPSGWTFEVQRRIGSGTWRTIRESLDRRSMSYRSSTDGTHRFRARLERANPPLSHRFSPVASITIS